MRIDRESQSSDRDRQMESGTQYHGAHRYQTIKKNQEKCEQNKKRDSIPRMVE